MKLGKEDLERFIFEEGKSYEEIGRSYGCTGSYVRKVAKKLGLSLPQRRRINPEESFSHPRQEVKYCLNCGNPLKSYWSKKYCCQKCFTEARYKKNIENWLAHPESICSEETPAYIRKFLMLKYNSRCEKCGWGELNLMTGNIPLEVHHINGDCTDNKLSNLQLLCPNCHSLTETFGALNRGNSKRYKLKKI